VLKAGDRWAEFYPLLRVLLLVRCDLFFPAVLSKLSRLTWISEAESYVGESTDLLASGGTFIGEIARIPKKRDQFRLVW